MLVWKFDLIVGERFCIDDDVYWEVDEVGVFEFDVWMFVVVVEEYVVVCVFEFVVDFFGGCNDCFVFGVECYDEYFKRC